MNETEMMYIAIGFILALTGFGILAMQVFQAWKDEKRKIEEDFTLSKQYEPKGSISLMMVFIMIASSSVIFVLLVTLMLSLGEEAVSIPVASDLVAKFIMLMGATALVSNIARIPNAKNAVRDFAYYPALPDDVKNTMKKENDPQKREKMIKEFAEEHGLKYGKKNFGKYLVFNAFPETNNLYILLITIQLLVFTGLLGTMENVQDISPEFSSTMFATGILFVILTLPSIFFMKKAAEMEMNDKNFAKKVLTAVYGFVPGIIGLGIMVYAMLPLLG